MAHPAISRSLPPRQGPLQPKQCHEGPASQVPHTLPKLPLTKNKKHPPILGSPLNTGYSQTCLPPFPFLQVTQANEEKSMAKAVYAPGSPRLTP